MQDTTHTRKRHHVQTRTTYVFIITCNGGGCCFFVQTKPTFFLLHTNTSFVHRLWVCGLWGAHTRVVQIYIVKSNIYKYIEKRTISVKHITK